MSASPLFVDAVGPSNRARPQLPTVVFVEVVRLFIVGLFTAAGYELAGGQTAAAQSSVPLLGALLGACVGYVHGGIAGRFLRRGLGVVEAGLESIPAVALLSGATGAVVLGAAGAIVGVGAVVMLPGRWGWSVLGLLAWSGIYVGFSTGVRKGSEVGDLIGRPVAEDGEPSSSGRQDSLVLVDSSVAMEGSLLAVARSGFLPGRLAVPWFVLDELQGLADASDPGRRRRGRRALETIDALRDEGEEGLLVLRDEVPDREDVDAKLVALAVRRRARLLTLDRNLVRVAELQGVRCLDLDRLRVALHSAPVPGEVVQVTIARPGKDPGQGVGFLDDGSMVVVAGADRLIGTEVAVAVTSSVPTGRGRLFFASLVDEDAAAV